MLYYEIKKIISNRSFKGLLLFFLVVSFLMLQFDINFSSDPRISNKALYEEVLLVVNKQNDDQRYDYLQNSLSKYKRYNEMINQENKGNGLNSYSTQEQEDFYRVLYDKGEKYITNRILVMEFMLSDYENLDYKEYVNGVNENLDKIIDNGSENSIVFNMKNYYSNLVKIEVAQTNSLALDAIHSQKFSNLLVLVFMIFLVNRLFFIDKDQEMDEVIELTTVGEKRIFGYKILAGILILFGFYFMTEIINLVFIFYKFGLPDLQIPIQSFSSYFTSPYKLNVYQFLMTIFIFKFIYILVNYFLLSTIYRVVKSRSVATFIYLVLLISSVFAYFYISKNSILISLKYFNLFSIGQITEMLSNYAFFSISIFSNTLPILVFFVCIISAMVLLFLLTVVVYYKIQIPNIYTKRNSMRITKWMETISVRKHEIIKSLFMEKTWLIITSFIIAISYLLFNISSIAISDAQQSRIDYITNNGGLINEEMNDHFDEKTLYWEKYESDYTDNLRSYKKGEIEEEDFNRITREYHEQSHNYRVFKQVSKQFYESSEYLIETSGYNILFSQYNYKYDHILSLVVILLIVGVFSNAFVIDNREQENDAYSLTRSGINTIIRHKYFIMLWVSIGAVLLSSVVIFIIINTKYSLGEYFAPMSSIINKEINSYGFMKFQFLFNIPIIGYCILVLLTRINAVVFIGLVSLTVSRMSRNRTQVFLILFTMFVITGLLYLSGFETFSFLNVFDMVSGNLFYRLGVFLPKVIYVLILNILLTYIYFNKKY